MKRARLKQVGDKHKKRLKAYSKAKKEWLQDHPYCQFVVGQVHNQDLWCNEYYGCTVHHKMRGGKLIADKRYFMTLCVPHHSWVEDHKKEARKLGYILYK